MDTLVFTRQLTEMKALRNEIAIEDDFNALHTLVNKLRRDVIMFECSDGSYVQTRVIDTTDELSYATKDADYTRESVLNILDSFLTKVELLGNLSLN